MRIVQALSTLAFGDAIGNHAVGLKKVLQRGGYHTEIYAEGIDHRIPKETAKSIRQLRGLKKSDIIIYHMSFGCPLNWRLREWKCRKILMYHNITPPEFTRQYSVSFSNDLQMGLEQTAQLAHSVERSIAMSEFNKRDLIQMGYHAEQIWAMPGYLIPFEDYEKEPDSETLRQYDDGWVNILFVGRFAPNKKQEDVIRTFAYYKKHINSRSRLILVGSVVFPEYVDDLQAYADKMGAPNVIFPGHVSFAQLIALYRSASVFLCMSEHEGFCVPLVEAMYFDVPIIAYCAAAIPDTLGGCGVLTESKDPVLLSMWIDQIINNPLLRAHILAGQRARLKQLTPEIVENSFLQYLQQII